MALIVTRPTPSPLMTVDHCPKNILQDVPSGVGQILVVASPFSGVSAITYGMERHGCGWFPALGAIEVVVGRNGIALPGEKREGDGKTPSGLFPLEGAFGYPLHATTKMTYRQFADDDVWVDDPDSPDYNTVKKRADTDSSSAESMRRTDNLYEYGLIIGYNRNPVVKGLGSAIFFHVWEGRGIATAGCIAMARDEMIATLAWLDPARNPFAAIATQGSTASRGALCVCGGPLKCDCY
jgi:L,D-peptidoglycan transpeptidase YkuD (ErfK/YbiS/YcfS/YnhG family)